jgi:two-component system, OmpR family, sensor histidine kinase VicK
MYVSLLNAQDREITKVIQGDKGVMEAVLSFISKSSTRIDACVDKSRPGLSKDIEQIRKLILNVRTRGVRIRYITEITKDNVYYCKQLLEIVDELRHLDGIIGAFYVSDEECLVPAIIHEKGKPASQIIYWNIKEIVKQQQYLFESLWGKAILAQQKIDEIEKGGLPEVIELIRNPGEVQHLVQKLLRSAEKEILVLFPSVNAFMRNVGNGPLAVEAANRRNVPVTVLTPMDEAIIKLSKEFERQSTNIRIRSIEPSSRSHITVLIVDRKFSLALELKDDLKSVSEEAVGNVTYSTSRSTVQSYVSMFESFMKLTKLYEESQLKLSETTDELEAMKRYVHEVLEEVDKYKKT